MRMAIMHQSSCCIHADDDYIDMELTSSPNFFCYSISSPPQSREFEFQMCSIANDKETTNSPADELFYKGKLLPLHLPPRLQMVQKLLQNPISTSPFDCQSEVSFGENYSIPFIMSPASFRPSSTTTTITPLESCNISPSESGRVSSELNPEEYFHELSTELNSLVGYNQQTRKSWTKKLKQSLLGQKLKASSIFLKSLFNKSGCANDSYAKATTNVEPEAVSKEKDCLNKYMKVAKRNPFGEIDNERYKLPNTLKKSIEQEMAAAAAGDSLIRTQRRSFSGVIQRHSKTIKSLSSTSSSGSSSSSSSFSFSSSNGGFYDLQLLKRSISANSEIENSIEGAIAYCKNSQQQLFCSRKTSATDVGNCSLSASGFVAAGDQELPKLCSI
eukprot:XP_002525012.2 probable membrane-associated kinase regulator 4 [Ricinus communis]